MTETLTPPEPPGTNDWLVPYRVDAQARQWLVCFPQAGSGSTVFAPWGGVLPDQVGVLGVRLPGRETRLAETPLDDLHAAADAMVAPITRLPPGEVWLFGHCSGSLLAYEVACRLADAGRRTPRALIVSAQAAPPPEDPGQAPPQTRWSDAEVVEYLRLAGETREEVLQSKELMDVLLPSIRADLRAAEQYARPADRQRLDLPVVALGAAEDHLVEPDALWAWRQVTRGPFSAHLLPGGHGYLPERTSEVIALIERHLREPS